VLRVASVFTLTLAAGTKLTCAQAVKQLTKDKQGWEVRSAGKGSKGERWYAWAWIGTASPRHHLLIRRHLVSTITKFGSGAISGEWLLNVFSVPGAQDVGDLVCHSAALS
jgi:hypothetical protein